MGRKPLSYGDLGKNNCLKPANAPEADFWENE